MTEEERSLTYVEIDMDFCQLTYGTSPCQAVLGDTGSIKCFNTRPNCQDPDNYDPAPLTMRYAMPTSFLPEDIRCIPNLKSVNTAPTKLNPGKNIGQRESVTITFQDHAYHDIGLDKYVEERKTGAAAADGSSYDPFEQGTYWGKWRNRNRYYLGRPLRLIQGKVGQSLSEMEKRHYVIEKVEGPSANGRFQITAKDVLKLADEDRSQAPKASPGVLRNDVATGSISSLVLDGASTSDYPSSGRVRINKEVFSYTGITTNGQGVELTGVSRAQLNTTEEEHDSEDTVQLIVSYEGERASDIIYDLLVNYGGVSSSYIDLTAWNSEDDEFIGRLYTGYVTEPTGVRDLLNELSQEAGFFIWSDVTVPEIKFRAVRTPGTTADDITDDDVVGEAPTPREQPKKRRSQVWVFYSRRTPTEPLDEQNNYRSISITVDANAASDEQYGQNAIEKIYSRWIAQFNRPAADDLGGRILARFRDPPRAYQFQLPYFNPELETGDLFNIISRTMQKPTGAPDPRRSVVLSVEREMGKMMVEAEEFNYDPEVAGGGQTVKAVVIDADALDFNLRDAFDSIYSTLNDGDTVECLVDSGVVVGSTSSTTPAFDVGNWPANITININNKGRIQGRGGDGGSATANSSTISAEDGDKGGTAFYTRYAVNLTNNKIYAGGGGGGGAAGQTDGGAGLNDPYFAAGGGGGAGRNVGQGGSGKGPSDGDDGSLDLGGDGSISLAVGVMSVSGGDGGDPAQAGTDGTSDGPNIGTTDLGNGGDPGEAIDGDSFITYDVTGDIKGAQIN